MDSEEENNEERRGKGRKRGKTGGIGGRGGNRGRGDRRNNGNRGGRGYRGSKNNRGKNGNYNNTKDNYESNYNANFNRNNEYNDNQDNEEDEKDEENYNDNSYYNNNNSRHNNNHKNKRKNSQKKNYQQNNNQKNDNNSFKHKEKKVLSFKKIKELSEKEDIDEVIMEFHNNENIYEEINNTRFQKEACYLLMSIIQKISTLNSEPVLVIVNKILENTNFIKNTVNNYIKENIFEDDKYLNFLDNVVNFLIECLMKNSNTKKINLNLSEKKNMLESLIKDDSYASKKEKMSSIIKDINNYEEKIKAINLEEFKREKKKREEIENKNKKENDKNYKDMDVIINTKEFTKEIKYRIDPNKIKGPYESYEKYINTMFFLEYEDCYRSLRRAIYNLIEDGKSLYHLDKQEKWSFERRRHDVYCYCDGEIIKAEMNHEGILLTIDFIPLSGRKIKFTKRMINGSLVIITDSEFKDFLLATVSYNPYIEKKLLEKSEDKLRKQKLANFNLPKEPRYRIKLELINIGPESFKFMIKNRTNLQLFESRAYFQSYIHVLNRLQKMVIKELPFEKEIIKANFNNLLITEGRQEYTYGKDNIIPNEDKFPESLRNKLDDSQLKALKHCLTSRIALIQGPPGTGKTHVGSIITNIIRNNIKKDSKILVVCFTNHALDQFLENILKDNSNNNIIDDERIVRIGGRCKNDIVKKLVLSSEKYRYRGYKEYERQLNRIGHEMADVIKLIDKTKRLVIDEVKEDFPEIYHKVINDFFKLLNIKKEDYIYKYPLDQNTKNKYKNSNLNKVKEDIIGYKIFHFWSFTGQQKNQISDLI